MSDGDFTNVRALIFVFCLGGGGGDGGVGAGSHEGDDTSLSFIYKGHPQYVMLGNARAGLEVK